MKFKILCKYGKYPAADGGTSSFFLAGRERANVVIDMGSGALTALEKNKIPLEKIDAIVLSHLHFDHMSDVLALVYKSEIYRKEGRINRKIPLYLPETPEDVFRLVKDADAFDLRVVTDGMSVETGSVTLTFFKMKHPVETYAVKCFEDGKSLSYTADTVYNDNIEKALAGSSAVFADACVLERDFNEKSPHISVREIARLTKKSGAKIVLIHLPPEGGHKEILDEALAENENSELGNENIWYEI
ncbi:MAG: MBL fold metallo-hydrolase [Clostridiales bacterium]|jgi:ribonuclease BN (tRNA processing enzyme)|nr:MBL fold metallo-hydrolase [Clostridiales bacterium]